MDAKDAYGHNIVNMLALALTIGETEVPKEEPKEIDYTKYHNIINEMRGD